MMLAYQTVARAATTYASDKEKGHLGHLIKISMHATLAEPTGAIFGIALFPLIAPLVALWSSTTTTLILAQEAVILVAVLFHL